MVALAPSIKMRLPSSQASFMSSTVSPTSGSTRCAISLYRSTSACSAGGRNVPQWVQFSDHGMPQAMQMCPMKPAYVLHLQPWVRSACSHIHSLLLAMVGLPKASV